MQELTTKAQLKTSYELSVAIVRDLRNGAGALFRVSLYAGESELGFVAGDAAGPEAAPSGQWKTFTVHIPSSLISSSVVGKPLEIRVLGNNLGPGGPTFDAIRLKVHREN